MKLKKHRTLPYHILHWNRENVQSPKLRVPKTCSRANVPCRLICSRANVPCVLTCLHAYTPT